MTYTLTTSGSYLLITLDEPLTANRQYTVTIGAGLSGIYGSGIYSLENDYTFWFTSAYCPLFSSLTRVKLRAGPSADSFIDDTIYRMIHKNSLDAVDLYNTYHNTTLAYDTWGCTWHSIPVVLRMYVECKTAYDILALLEMAAAGAGGLGGGGQLKTLGDLTIKYDGTSNKSSAVDPSLKKQLYDCWIEAMNAIKNVGGAAGLQYAVRGWYDTSKGFSHPTWDTDHNRIIRTVDFKRSHPTGPWTEADDWRSNI